MPSTGHRMTRRQLLHTAGSVALAAGISASIIIPGRASAQQKTLKILQIGQTHCLQYWCQ